MLDVVGFLRAETRRSPRSGGRSTAAYSPRMFQLASTLSSAGPAGARGGPGIPPCDEAETVYLGIVTSLRLTATVRDFEHAGLLLSTFPQLHAALQHSAMHFSGCAALMRDVLPTYESLAGAAIRLRGELEGLDPQSGERPSFQRQALVSLTKVSGAQRSVGREPSYEAFLTPRPLRLTSCRCLFRRTSQPRRGCSPTSTPR